MKNSRNAIQKVVMFTSCKSCNISRKKLVSGLPFPVNFSFCFDIPGMGILESELKLSTMDIIFSYVRDGCNLFR